MDRRPFHGRITILGDPTLSHVTRSLLLTHLDLSPERFTLQDRDGLRSDDLLIDLDGSPTRLARCRERGVLYLSAVQPARTGLTDAGSTAVLGHGAWPGLTAHLGRIALRDLAARTLGNRAADLDGMELAKLLREGDSDTLARLSGVRTIRPLTSANRSEGWAVLGVLVSTTPGSPAWWTGSLLDDAEASRHVAGCDAVTMQTAVGLLSAALWMVQNPRHGIRIPDQLPYEEILEVALPYLGRCVSHAVGSSTPG